MKIPVIGEVKPVYLYIGGGVVAVAVAYGYYKKKKSANAAAGATAGANAVGDTSNQGDGSIDPVTGIPYADEGGVYGYGAVDPSTGVPYQYESTTSATTQQYSTNEDWASAGIAYAQSDLGATQTLAQSAVRDYLAQPVSGLIPAEYTLMSELLALIGPPPVGSFKLQENFTTGGGNPPSNGGGGTASTTKSLAPGEVIQVQVNIVKPKTMASVAKQFGISLQHLINNNPGSSSTTTGVVNVPYLVKSGDSLTSIASRFGISPEHLAQELSTQGII